MRQTNLGEQGCPTRVVMEGDKKRIEQQAAQPAVTRVVSFVQPGKSEIDFTAEGIDLGYLVGRFCWPLLDQLLKRRILCPGIAQCMLDNGRSIQAESIADLLFHRHQCRWRVPLRQQHKADVDLRSVPTWHQRLCHLE